MQAGKGGKQRRLKTEQLGNKERKKKSKEQKRAKNGQKFGKFNGKCERAGYKAGDTEHILNVEHQYTRPYVTSFSLTFSNDHYKV